MLFQFQTRFLAIAIAMVAQSFCMCECVRAEFIVDDFDDSVIAKSPESDEFATTPNVGPLDATRQVRIAWLQGEPDGQLDSNISNPSALTGIVSRLNPRNQFSRPIVSLQFEYAFSPVDFTQGGVNDTLYLDFRRLESEIPPSLLLILIGSHAYLGQDIPRSAQPFTVAIPFSSFAPRGGGPGVPDYTAVRGVEFEIRPSQLAGGGPDPLNFVMELDRVRVGRQQVVPEPHSLCFLLIGWFSFATAFRLGRGFRIHT